MKSNRTSLKILLWLCCLIGLLLAFMVVVNAYAPSPTYEQLDDRVTRYSHNNPDPRDADKPLARVAMILLASYSTVFGGLGFGAYQFLNILIYALFLPSILLWVTYWAFKPLGRPFDSKEFFVNLKLNLFGFVFDRVPITRGWYISWKRRNSGDNE